MALEPARTAIITGAGSGIGLGIARALAQQGIALCGVGRDERKLEALAEALPAGHPLLCLPLDITGDDAPQQVVKRTLERFGRLDFLINNAGAGHPRPLHETDDAMLDGFLDLMLRAPFRLAREAVPSMTPGGAVINISSTFAVVGGLRGGAYSLAKAGLHGLTSHIACQYGAQGIRANCVAPGIVMTDMIRDRLNDERFRRMNLEMTPHQRMGTVEDVAATVAFLCSEGGSFINGQTIVVDGGWSSTKYLSDFGRTARWLPQDGD